MRKHFFRPFIADPVCASPDPGHHVDVGRYFMAVVKSSVTIPVRAEVRDGFVGLDWGEGSAELWNHRPDDVAVALQGNNGVAEWAPEWRVLIVTVLETPLTLTWLSLHAIVLFSLTPATLICPPDGAVVTVFAGPPPPGAVGGMLGMEMPGTLGNSRVDLFTMNHPTPPATAMKTKAPSPSTTHGMPAEVFRGGGAHGAL